MSFEASLLAQLQSASDAVTDVIARDGLMLLKRTLDSAGFVKSPYLKDYEVFASVTRTGIVFEILLNVEAVEADREILEQSAHDAEDAFEDASERVYHVISRGGFARVARMKDNRRPVPRALNRPRRTKSNLREWGSRSVRRESAFGPRSAFKTSEKRKLEHKLAGSSPRDMHIDRAGRLSIRFERQTRTTKTGEMHFPQGQFQGIVKQFIDDLKKIVLTNFAPELEKILKRYVES